MRRIIGVDPGLAGGLGILDLPSHEGERMRGQRAQLVRTPVVRTRRRARDRIEYDLPAMHELLQHLTRLPEELAAMSIELVLEEQQAMPRSLRGRHQGGSSTFRVGLGFGVWLGLVTAARVPFTTVRPAEWKKHHHLNGCDKRASRLRCGQLFPILGSIAASNEGPAEALLLAAFIAQTGPPARKGDPVHGNAPV
jgi:hypothetical protein